MSQCEHRDSSLMAALRALAEDDSKMGASRDVEARLLANVRAIRSSRRRRQYRAALAVAAVLTIVALATWRLTTPAPHPSTVATLPPATTHEIVTDFFPLQYSNIPATDGHVVRLEIPRTALALFGLGDIQSVEPTSSTTVLADVIVGEDGLARAVRFVRSAAHQEQSR
jgi:hypothetical protein